MSLMQPEKPDIAEHGAQGATSDRRLFMQFRALTDCFDTAPLIDALVTAGIEAVVYRDAHDATGVGLVTMAEDPAFFVDTLCELLRGEAFAALTPRPEFTMFGRTYSLGYEHDLDDALLHRPRRHALEPAWPWAVWYPLRRKGAFEALPEEEKKDILRQHAVIGMAYGKADLAHDIRLACHGLDTNDNDFVIGLMGSELAALSILVQTMRSTRQTSEYIERLGPFFVGRAVWRSAMG